MTVTIDYSVVKAVQKTNLKQIALTMKLNIVEEKASKDKGTKHRFNSAKNLKAEMVPVVFSDYVAPACEAIQYLKSVGNYYIRKLNQRDIAKKI